ncbi:hypothetical protein [Vibrio sp. WXL103]|uniref:hypothetical protein n=1 Tax=unclassified Vibrio TaxID=2614977 RepID=UPI003EC93367
MTHRLIWLAIALAPLGAQASGLYVSPELKIGPFRGAGLQLGVSQVGDFDNLFLHYSKSHYTAGRYDENIDTYRVGLQSPLGRRDDMGIQAIIGLADYDGTYRDEHKTTMGLSIGAAFVYKLTPALSVRAGTDFDFFDSGSTHTFSDTSINFTLGFGLTL